MLVRSVFPFSKAVLFCIATLLLTSCEHDYGDAPNGGPTGYPQGILVGGATVPAVGTFPSLEASDGARVDSVADATLGPGATLEGDALVTNLDDDDGGLFMMIFVVSIPPPAQMIVEVTGHTPGTYFLNGLIDLNMNGNWGDVGPNGEQEWVIQNYPVTIAGTTSVIPLPFAYGWGNRLPNATWMRLMLSDVMVPSPWDGTGEFATGEVEDHFITLPLSDGGGGGGDPCDAKPIPRMFCNGPYRFPDGVDQIPVRCSITNTGGAGNVNWTLAPIAGCPVTLAPAADLTGPRAIGCPNGRIDLNFVATRGDPLPCSWSFNVTAQDPPSVRTSTGLIAGYTDSTGSFLLTGEADEYAEVWVHSIEAELDAEANNIMASVTLNEESLEYSAGAFVDIGIMYPDGELMESRAELADGAARTEFAAKGQGVHMIRVVRVVGNQLHYVPEKDKTMMDAVVLPAE